MRVIGAKLIGSWPTFSGVPNFGLPEIALIGRSNVGKSTLVNSLVDRKSLARVSGTPGKTQEAVIFEVELELGPKLERKKITLVDLPGFGFAKVSKDKRRDFHKLIVEFVSQRQELSAICLLNDCRREPGEDELTIWKAGIYRGCKCGLVITKVDKLGNNARREAVRQVSNSYLNHSAIIESGTSVTKSKIQEGVFGILFSETEQ